MRNLPPRDCLVLIDDGERKPFLVHALFVADPMPTWSRACDGEPIDLGQVVTWVNVPELG